MTITTTTAAVQYILKDFRYYLFDHRAKIKLDEIKRAKKEVINDSRRVKKLQAKARRMDMAVNKKELLLQQQKVLLATVTAIKRPLQPG